MNAKVKLCTPAGCINALFNPSERSDADVLDAIERKWEALTGTPMYKYEREATLEKIERAREDVRKGA